MPKQSLIAPYIQEIFKGVSPGWKKIILNTELKPIFNECLRKLDNYLISKGVTSSHISKNGLSTYIRPKPQHILQAFKYTDPSNIVCIIIGQDPYPKLEDADGLCFSSKSKARPKSLGVIYKCLINSNYLSPETETTNELNNWAKQGVLLLNRYLTRSPNIKKNEKGEIWIDGNGDSNPAYMHEFWGNFTMKLLNYLSVNSISINLTVMLWGKIAQELDLYIDKSNTLVLKWCHPTNRNLSEQNEQHFVHCDHFSILNAKLKKLGLPEINWNPNYKPDLDIYPIVVGVDGACTSNGYANAKASYGAYFPSTFNGKPNGIPELSIYGLVPKKVLELTDKGLKELEIPEKVTNNRGELLGLIYAFLQVIKRYEETKVKRPVYIIEDSTYCLHLVNSRLWKYLKTDPKLNKVTKNKDLVLIIKSLLFRISEIIPTSTIFNNEWDRLIQPNGKLFEKEKCLPDLNWKGLTMIHQNSHLNAAEQEIVRKKGGSELESHLLNVKADELCNLAMDLNHYDTVFS